MRDALNRQRWAVDQRSKARTAYARPNDDGRLAELQQLAGSLEAFPHMAYALATVRAEISRLQRNA